MSTEAASPAATSAPSAPDRLKDLGLRLAASFLILWTPFFFFSAYRGHPVPAAELLYSVVLFAIPALAVAWFIGPALGARRVGVLALLVGIFLDLQFSWFGGVVGAGTTLVLAGLFWLIREHLVLILGAIFGATLASTMLAPPAPSLDNTLLAPAGADGVASRGDPRSDTLVHLVLDEFAGVRGIPLEIEGAAALRRELSDFFGRYDFTLYPEAFSEYPSSKHSIGTLLNFEAGPNPKENFRGKRPYVLLRNRAFELVRERYAEMHVTQSNYMDFCSESSVPLDSCFTYRFDGTDWLGSAALDDRAKLDVLLGMYFNLPGFFEFAAKTYVRTRNRLAGIGLSLPQLRDWDGTVAPIAANQGFDHFAEGVLAGPPGSAHFGHLLLPHGPYVYDAECRLTQEPLDWLGPRPRHEKANTDASRKLRYEHYFPQVRCTLLRLGAFFEELKSAGKWQETTIILHGDHGARFYRTKLLEENRDRITREDLADGYSTLFAIKPRTRPAIDETETQAGLAQDQPFPLSRLLAHALEADMEAGESSASQAAIVYIEGDDRWFEMDWPSSGEAGVGL